MFSYEIPINIETKYKNKEPLQKKLYIIAMNIKNEL